MERFEFKSIEQCFFHKNQQIPIKRDRHRGNENLVEFSIQLPWQTRRLVYKVAKEISQNTGS